MMATASQSFHPHYAPYHPTWPSPQQAQQQQHPTTSAPLPSASSHASPDQVLIATGKKRKRLQRACVACHKAKRRCDGGLPCSNCDFSGRTCSYSDSQGKAVAPTKRTLKPSEAAMQQQQQQQMQLPLPHQPGSIPAFSIHRSPSSGPSYMRTSSHSQSPSLDHSQSPRADESRQQSTSSRIEPSLECRRELLCIFFSHIQPLNSVFDEISFLRDLSSMEVSWVLLYAMYAVSAKHAYDHHHHHQQQTSSANNAKYSKLVGEAGDGSIYAKEARRLLHCEDERSNQSLIDGKPSMEVAQALCLLSYFEFTQGRGFRASSYIQQSSKHVTSLRLHLGQVPASASENGEELEMSLRHRHAKRLASLVIVMDVAISMMNGQTMSTKPWDVEAAIDSIGQLRQQDDDDTVATVKLLNVSFVLNSALELSQRCRNGSSSIDVDRQVRKCQHLLQRWAEELPRNLRFNESQLNSVGLILSDRARLRSPTFMPQMTKASAVCWTLMHTMAETTTLILKDLGGASLDRSDKLAACKNLVILLEQSHPSSLPRLFATLAVAVLYSVSCGMTAGRGEDREWSQVTQMARSFASFAPLNDAVWASMASWWTRDHPRQSLSPPSATSLRLPAPSPPMSVAAPTRRHVSSSPLQQPHPMPASSGNPRMMPSPSSSSNYHHLPPLNTFPSSSTVLPPLRLSPPEKTARLFWDQPPRSMTVKQS